MSSSSPRASRRPSLMWKLPSRSGSLIRPFQPTVVRGFSKYTRMMISSSPLKRSRCSRRRPRVFQRRGRVVNRARPDDDGETIVSAVQDALQAAARGADSRGGLFAARIFAHELFGRAQLPDVADAQVVGTNVHGVPHLSPEPPCESSSASHSVKSLRDRCRSSSNAGLPACSARSKAGANCSVVSTTSPCAPNACA